MRGIRQKQLTQPDLDDLKVCMAALSRVPYAGTASSPLTLDDLLVNGSAHIIIAIERAAANVIWELMEMSKDHEKSAYPDVMIAESVTLTANLFKVGTLFTTFYIANATISCWGSEKNFKVDFGAIAEKRITLIVDRLVKLLMFQKAIAPSTEQAVAQMK